MKIVLLEAFFTGSHKKWALGLQKYSKHSVTILSLKGRHWKWRMHGAAISLAKQYDALDFVPDLILATDMLDFASFLAFTKGKTAYIKTAIYFHENQLTYPWSANDKDVALQRDFHYAFINYCSALVADQVFFNSSYHKNSFLSALKTFLKRYPDYNELWTIERIKQKSEVLYLGMDLKPFSPIKKQNETPILLWNHRWEYDKNPDLFFNTLKRLKDKSVLFRLIVLGERAKKHPNCFDEAQVLFKEEIIHFGYIAQAADYFRLMAQADILPICSNQDFFGGSIVEALSLNIVPLLPNRLSYPEHIDIDTFPHLFYESDQEFFEKLYHLIASYAQYSSHSFRENILKYDWNNIIKIYDKTFAS